MAGLDGVTPIAPPGHPGLRPIPGTDPGARPPAQQGHSRVTIECLSVTLSIVMLLTSGLVTAVMSITTGNTAVDATAHSGADALNTCFAAAETNVADMVERMMGRAMGDAAGRTHSFLDNAMSWTRTMYAWLRLLPPADVQKWDWFNRVLRSRMYQDIAVMREAYVSGLMVLTLQGQDAGPHYLLFSEDAGTIMNPPDGYHMILMVQHDGQPGKQGVPDWGAPQTASGKISKLPRPGCNILGAEADDRGLPTNMDKPCNVTGPAQTNGSTVLGNCPLCFGGWSVWQEAVNRSMGRGCIHDRVFGTMEEPEHCHGKGSAGDGTDPEAFDPPDTLLWSPSLAGGNTLKNYAYVTWTHPDQPEQPVFGKRVGLVSALVDSRAVSQFLRSVPIPGASRMYVVERSPWSGVTEQIVGTTHGKAFYEQFKRRGPWTLWTAFAMPAWNCSDPIVRDHAAGWLAAHFPSGGGGAPFDTATLHRWRDGSGDVWFFKGSRIEHNPGGLQWWLNLLVPRREVMRTIDAASAETRARIQSEHAAMEEEKEHDQDVMYGVLAAIAAVLIVCSVAFTRVIVAPLHELQHRMASVAEMRLEDAGTDRSLSRLNEVRAMQQSFRKMVQELKEFRSFLPQSCLPAADDDIPDDHDDDERSDSSLASTVRRGPTRPHREYPNLPSPSMERESTSATAPKPIGKWATQMGTRLTSQIGSPRINPSFRNVKRTSSGGQRTSRRSSMGEVRSVQSTGDKDSVADSEASKVKTRRSKPPSLGNSPGAARGIPRSGTAAGDVRGGNQQLQQQLRKRQVSLVAANVCGYLNFARATALEHVRMLHAGLLGAMVAQTASRNGITDGTTGDRFFASVNAARPATAHRAAAVGLAWALAAPGHGDATPPHLLRQLAAAARVDGTADAPDGIAAAACAGEVICGVVGCDGVKSFQVLGAPASWVRAAERLASQWRAVAVANHPAKADTPGFHFRARESAALDRPSHRALRPQLIWEVCSPVAARDNEEWMYQLEKDAAEDPYRAWNKAFVAFERGDVAAAERHIAAGRGGAGARAVPAEAYDALSALCAAPPEPRHRLLHGAWLYRPALAAKYAPIERRAASSGGRSPTEPAAANGSSGGGGSFAPVMALRPDAMPMAVSPHHATPTTAARSLPPLSVGMCTGQCNTAVPVLQESPLDSPSKDVMT